MKQLTTLLFLLCTGLASAQLPDGSVAPDFTATDLNGVEHNLYSYLDSGYQVILDFSATWCGPCWSYHESGVLEELYDTYGPDGTNELRVFFIEGDDGTTQADLEGTGPSTAGDWITGTHYPIIDNAENIFDAFECTYYPTIYTVCPSGLLTESGQATVAGHTSLLQSASCAPASLPNDPMLVGYSGDAFACGGIPAQISVRLLNQGLEPLTSCAIQVSRVLPFNQTEVVGTYDWEGNLDTYELADAALTTLDIDDLELLQFDIVSEDDNTENNQVLGQIQLSEQTVNNLQVRILTDAAPEQTGWSIANEAGEVVASVDPGAEALGSQAVHVWDVTLDDLGCHTFTLIDTEGDGHIAGAASLADVGSLIVTGMDGETSVGQVIQFQTTDDFSSVEFQFEVTAVSSVAEPAALDEFRVAPNPVEDQAMVHMALSQPSEVTLQVLDAQGRVVERQNWGWLPAGAAVQSWSTAHLEPGMYLVTWTAGGNSWTQRLVKR